MLKRQVTYTDFNDEQQTEELSFHLSKAELIEMELSMEGGVQKHLETIIATDDGKAIMEAFKEIILRSYGVRSPDGKRFIKNDQIREEFLSSEAYSELFMSLVTDPAAAADFVNGILPNGLEADVAKMERNQLAKDTYDEQEALAVTPLHPDPKGSNPKQLLTRKDVAEMASDELRQALANGAIIVD